MAWIKRNLYFVIGSLIAVALMGFGGFLLYQQMADESDVSEQIKKLYSELDDINRLPVLPGTESGPVDNVKSAREQQAILRSYIDKMRPFLKPITPIPDPAVGKISNADIATQLRDTISQMQKTADQQSVSLPHDYFFTFEAQRRLMIFDAASHDKLAVHLGEIKTICDVLFTAKVNSLEFLRREIASPTDDTNMSDYLPPDEKTISTPLADLTPYRVSFQCFSGELASVLANFASSPYGLIVKSVNVEPASASAGGPGSMVSDGMPFAPGGPPQNQRYFPPPNQGGPPSRISADGTRFSPVAPGYPMGATPPPAAARPGAPVTLVNEKPLRVSMMIDVIKLKPGK